MDAMKKYGFFENRFFPAVFLLLSFAFLLVFSFSTSPLYAYTGFDSATFRTIGLGILQGKLPYADLFDHKGPLAFYFNAAGIGIIPGDWGIFLMQVLFMAVSAYLIYRTDCLFTDRKTAFVCVLLLFFPFVDFIVEGNQCEEWMMPFVTLSVYLVLSWMMRGEGLPYSDTLIKLADHFNCQTDYLLGLTDTPTIQQFKSAPPFCQQLGVILKHFNITKYRLEKQTGLSEKTVNRWHNGKTTPTADSLIRMAQFFDCSVDFLLGRV